MKIQLISDAFEISKDKIHLNTLFQIQFSIDLTDHQGKVPG